MAFPIIPSKKATKVKTWPELRRPLFGGNSNITGICMHTVDWRGVLELWSHWNGVKDWSTSGPACM